MGSPPHPPNPKRRLFASLARTGRALANGSRLEIIEFLAQRERNVEELARMCGISVANASQHLRTLREAGLVTSRRDGNHVCYCLAGPEVFPLLQSLRQAAEAGRAEIERQARDWRAQNGTLEEVSLPELRRRMASGEVLLIDVRPPEEFSAGHIDGARSIPLADLPAALGGLPDGLDVVAYCRGPHCFLSDDAVALLRAGGRSALRLAAGFPDWQALGWPVARA
jgi:rhodanese-related sulfurtransferase/predicted transcriptional regulator